jgi:hypothetical protein
MLYWFLKYPIKSKLVHFTVLGSLQDLCRNPLISCMITSSHEGCVVNQNSATSKSSGLSASHRSDAEFRLLAASRTFCRRSRAGQVKDSIAHSLPAACNRPVSLSRLKPFLSCGLDTAEPHIRSPLGMAGTKIPHTRGDRARKADQSLARHLAARTL